MKQKDKMKNKIVALYVLIIISIIMNIIQMICTPKMIEDQHDLIIYLDSIDKKSCEFRDSTLINIMCEQDISLYKELNKRLKHEKDTITIVHYPR